MKTYVNKMNELNLSLKARYELFEKGELNKKQSKEYRDMVYGLRNYIESFMDRYLTLYNNSFFYKEDDTLIHSADEVISAQKRNLLFAPDIMKYIFRNAMNHEFESEYLEMRKQIEKIKMSFARDVVLRTFMFGNFTINKETSDIFWDIFYPSLVKMFLFAVLNFPETTSKIIDVVPSLKMELEAILHKKKKTYLLFDYLEQKCLETELKECEIYKIVSKNYREYTNVLTGKKWSMTDKRYVKLLLNLSMLLVDTFSAIPATIDDNILHVDCCNECACAKDYYILLDKKFLPSSSQASESFRERYLRFFYFDKRQCCDLFRSEEWGKYKEIVLKCRAENRELLRGVRNATAIEKHKINSHIRRNNEASLKSRAELMKDRKIIDKVGKRMERIKGEHTDKMNFSNY